MIICEVDRVEGASDNPSRVQFNKTKWVDITCFFKKIFVVKTRESFCELALSIGRRELIMIFTSLSFFFITRARLIKPSEITSGSLCPMLLVPQWIKICCTKGSKDTLFMHHSTFSILSPTIPKFMKYRIEFTEASNNWITN